MAVGIVHCSQAGVLPGVSLPMALLFGSVNQTWPVEFYGDEERAGEPAWLQVVLDEGAVRGVVFPDIRRGRHFGRLG